VLGTIRLPGKEQIGNVFVPRVSQPESRFPSRVQAPRLSL
jgi:hypothetical protein